MNRDILLVCLFLFSVLVIMIKVHGIYIGIDSMLNDCNLLYKRTRIRATLFRSKFRSSIESYIEVLNHVFRIQMPLTNILPNLMEVVNCYLVSGVGSGVSEWHLTVEKSWLILI